MKKEDSVALAGAKNTGIKIITLQQSATKATLGGFGPVIELWPYPSGKYG